jgi:hypothetical protein
MAWVPGGADDEGVAVGLGLGDRVGRDIAAGAGLVLDDELLTEFFRQFCRDHPRQDVGGAAGRERHHEFHRPGRPVRGERPMLRKCGKRGTADQDGAAGGVESRQRWHAKASSRIVNVKPVRD